MLNISTLLFAMFVLACLSFKLLLSLLHPLFHSLSLKASHWLFFVSFQVYSIVLRSGGSVPWNPWGIGRNVFCLKINVSPRAVDSAVVRQVLLDHPGELTEPGHRSLCCLWLPNSRASLACEQVEDVSPRAFEDISSKLSLNRSQQRKLGCQPCPS